ncbi:hypothetical protein L6164_025685 [Bauhinia variegata]|uniref:Uncharacterized protein n=2 Tax=Bauhinia variegata TaxID=167791 RepID=A0ACB9M1M8_BAUVA|nr:hypothetical protein L6164_025685 [Bauhinia variegata]
MSSRRASLLAVSSLTTLCKGHPSNSISDSINTLKTISTAAESSDFQFAGGYNVDESSGYQQNHDWLHRESQNHADFQRRSKGQSPGNVIQANESGFSWGSSPDNLQSANPDWASREGGRNKFVNKAGHGENFVGSYGKNHEFTGRICYGIDRISDGGQLNSSRNVSQNKFVGENGKLDGFYGQSNIELQQNVNGVSIDNSRGFGKRSNPFLDSYNGNNNQYSGSSSNYLDAPSRNSQSSHRSWDEGPREIQYSNSKGNFTQNIGRLQQAPNDGYPASNDLYLHNPISGQYQQNLSNGQYPPNSNTVQNSSMVSPHSPNNAKSNVRTYKGTLEELDNLCKEGKVKEAVEVLVLLEKQHIRVDLPRYLQLMHQCGEAKSLDEGKIIHEHVLRYVSPLHVSTYNRILEMYSKCGSMDDALAVYNKMPERNLTTWDTMITWLATNGFAEDAIDLFTEFKKLGLRPDGQIYIGVFAACSMLGDIDEGMLHFESMRKDHGIEPSLAHYVSVVDMFGSVGHLDEAFEFIEKMPIEPSVDVWETLMNLCRVHGHLELGDRCAELVEQLDPSRLIEQSKAGLLPIKPSDLVQEKEKKNQNLLEVRSRVHEYRAGDTSHPETDKIYALLRCLRSQMKEAGYIPETKFVLHDIDQESKEEALLSHSERLAVGYGLISSAARSPIRVIKNLRFCGDCHNALKIVSKLVGRELIIRDAKRFHHFRDGVCSCRDYW